MVDFFAGRFAPGVYTLAVAEVLPEEFQVRLPDSAYS